MSDQDVRAKGRPSSSWGAFFTADQAVIFETLVAATLREHGIEVIINEAGAHSQGDEEQHFGLRNVAALCRGKTEDRWPGIIEDHFSALLRNFAEDPFSEPFERLSPLLKVRLYGNDLPGLDTFVHRPVADDLVAMLVLDLPRSVVGVGRKQSQGWGLDDEALFDLALTQTGEPLDLDTVELEDGGELQVAQGESFFVASQMLRLSEWVDPQHPHGALVAVPTRHTLLILPIEAPGSLLSVRMMLLLARGLHERGPGSLSASIYWWCGGELEHLSTHLDEENKTLELRPSAAFARMMAGLREPS